MGDASNFIKNVKGLDTSGVEVDEEQVAPMIAAGSAEEKAELAKMEELLKASGFTGTADEETKLMCLRGRKYDAERAAELLPKVLELVAEYASADTEQLKKDTLSQKFCYLGSKDDAGRGVLWVRLRNHNPKESKAPNMARFITTLMLQSVLKDVDSQRQGIAVVNDMTGLKLSNLDPATAKAIFGSVFPRLPVRVGRICIFNPPWILGHVILPVVLTFMSRKLRGRIAVVNGNKFDALQQYIPSASLPEELGGTLKYDAAAWCQQLHDKL